MKKTKWMIFTLVALWLAFYVSIFLMKPYDLSSPAAVKGVSIQQISDSPDSSFLQQRFYTENIRNKARQLAVPIPVTSGVTGEEWIGAAILFSVVALVGICARLLLSHVP